MSRRARPGSQPASARAGPTAIASGACRSWRRAGRGLASCPRRSAPPWRRWRAATGRFAGRADGCGGLLDALSPERAEAKLDPASGAWRTAVEGFNHKNEYTRITPCDKDFLRKRGRQTPPRRLEHWFGTAVPREYARQGAFDPAGLFAADGTYLFVPLDNDGYENSSVLRFDEHNHPVGQADEEKMPPQRRKRLRWRRCYRAITLSHLAAEGDYSLRCGTTVLSGNAAESPAVRPLVERFLGAVGPGVLKLLLFDRGLIDGATVAALKHRGVDSLFPLKHGMDLWTDALVLAQHDGLPWEHQRLLDALLPTENKVVLSGRPRFGFFTPYEHQELLLTVKDGARRKLLGKTRRLRRAQLAPPDHLPWRTP